jgi:membrane protease YdiL (CAAX protease family)
MDRISPAILAFSILCTLLMAALLGMLWAWAWALGRIWKGLPIVAGDRTWPLKPAGWGSMTVLCLVLLYVGVNVSVRSIYAVATGLHSPLVAKGVENQGDAREPGKATDQPRNAQQAQVPGEAAPDGQNKDLKAGSQAPGPESPPEQSLAELMFQFALSNVLLLVIVPVVVRFTSGAGLADLGLRRQEWARQMGIGVRAALLMTPPVAAIQFLAVRIWHSQPHPVELMVLGKLTPGVAILAVLSTMVLAPLIEELLFRGILQRWLGRFVEDRPFPAATSLENGCSASAADGWSATLEPEHESLLWDSEYAPPRSSPVGAASELLDNGHQPAERLSSRSSNLPILFTSILFAAMHLPQWPAPIAIFLLSMALGTVYQRTGSLLAAITMHATFNGINTILLLLAAVGQHLQATIQPTAGVFSASGLLAHFLCFMGFR